MFKLINLSGLCLVVDFRMLKLEGVFVPHVTPFKDSDEVDVVALRDLVGFFLESGLHGLVPLGSNGEFPNLSFEERLEVLKVVVDEVNGKVPVVAGAGAPATAEVIRFARVATDLGVDGFLVAPPFYYTPSDREVFDYYSMIASKVDSPILLYSIPKFVGYHLNLDVVERLALEHSNIVGIKDSGGLISRFSELVRRVGKKIKILAGTGDMILPALVLGAHGAIVAVANVAPRQCVELYEAFRGGNLERARELQVNLNYLNEVVVKKYNQLSAIKVAMNLLGLKVGRPRHPYAPLGEKEANEISKVLRELGLMKS
jgi:4-hydroxy-tetrahydrodipicolinate synthase